MFDRDKLVQTHVRKAKKGESLILLDDKEIKLDPDCLVISDEKKPIALAGIMGEKNITLTTRSLFFLESAFFKPSVIRGRARRFGVSKQMFLIRFERREGLQSKNLLKASEISD